MTEKVDALAGLIDPYTGDNELNGKIARALAPHVALDGATEPLLGEILDTLKSIDAKLTPPTVELKPAFKPVGRVFAVGQIIPDDVDLVQVGAGVRWKRDTGPHGVPLDSWYPRDGEGPMISGNELLTRAGHVTEIPAPGSAAT